MRHEKAAGSRRRVRRAPQRPTHSQLPLIKGADSGASTSVISLTQDPSIAIFKEAMRKGVTVITVDSDLTDNEQNRRLLLTVDPEDVAEAVELLGR